MKYNLITILFLLFACCKKQPYIPVTIDCTLSKNIDTLKQLLPGSWIWLQEERYVRTPEGAKLMYLTPKTEGYTLKMVFRNDSAFSYKNNILDSVYKYNVVKLRIISGTNFPEDEDPVLVFYTLSTGLRSYHVPIKGCNNYLVKQFQYVSSIAGETIWKKE
ncbi:MAG: hypothetical protein KGZ74_08705 [Chitinophagaceae bacterium]|nr:hypothetical protein [Chitinophagaceae bacterium]